MRHDWRGDLLYKRVAAMRQLKIFIRLLDQTLPK